MRTRVGLFYLVRVFIKVEGNIKEPKTFKEQIEILKSRQLTIDNDEEAINILKKVNYY